MPFKTKVDLSESVRMPDGAAIARCSYDDAKLLQEKRYVIPSKKRSPIWIAMVDAHLIHQQLKVKIGMQVPTAEDNRTVIRDGQTWQHHQRRCDAYGPEAKERKSLTANARRKRLVG